jgi:hypothetical protein
MRREVLLSCVDVLLAEGPDDVLALEQTALLLRGETVLDIAVLEDLREPPAAAVLARDVRDDLLLGRRAGEEK